MNPDTSAQIAKLLCGSFKPQQPLQPNWIAEFMGSNIGSLLDIIAPGERFQCMSHDTFYINPDDKQDLIINYVPFHATTPLFGMEPLGDQSVEHYFIFRTFVLEKVAQHVDLNLEQLDDRLLTVLWNQIGSAVRKMLQRKYGEKLSSLPFSVLTDLGVDPESVSESWQQCMRVCELDNLQGYCRLAFMDLCSVGTLIQYLAVQSALTSLNVGCQPMDFNLLAKKISFGVPE